MVEDADEAKLYRMAGWASRQEHNKKRIAALFTSVHSEIARQYGKAAPLPAAKLAIENLIDKVFQELVAKESSVSREGPDSDSSD